MKALRACISGIAAAAVVAILSISAPTIGHAQTQMCPANWQSVCGVWKDGKKHTYANDCWAKRDGAKRIKPGACK